MNYVLPKIHFFVKLLSKSKKYQNNFSHPKNLPALRIKSSLEKTSSQKVYNH